MAVRLIAGRAGSGKTARCLEQIGAELARSLIEGPRLLLVVPEQAALQMERALLTRPAIPVLGRCEVLSFRRLAHRILNTTTGPSPVPMSPIGRQMALRHLISRHRSRLSVFQHVAERPGFIASIARSVTELIQEAVAPADLSAAAEAAREADEPDWPRMNDLAVLYAAYLEYLDEGRIDPEGVIDLARERLAQAPWLADARIWIDGFAGFTRQQMRMIASLAQRAADVEIALLLDPQSNVLNAASGLDDMSLFARTERTWDALSGVLRTSGVEIEPPVRLNPTTPHRFPQAPDLVALETDLFRMPAAGDASAREVPLDVDGWKTPAPRRQVRLIVAADRRTEVNAAVRAALDLVQREQAPLRYRDIAFVVRNLEPYHDLLADALSAHGIPHFIDRRRPTLHHPLIQAVRSLLAMHASGVFQQAIVGLLKSGLSALTPDDADRLDNYLLARAPLGPEQWDAPWTPSEPPDSEADDFQVGAPITPEALQAINNARAQLRQRLDAWWPCESARTEVRGSRAQLRQRLDARWPAEATRDPTPTCRAWIERLYAALTALGVREHIADWCTEAERQGRLDEIGEHEQAWTDFAALLDELADILGDEPMDGRRFREIVEAGFADFTLGLVPATIDQVLVGSIERSRHPDVRAVFLLGFNDGAFPARAEGGPVLDDAARERLAQRNLHLPRSARQQILDERLLAYVAVTRPSEHLWISYPGADVSGTLLAPSPYWAMIRGVLPNHPVERTDGARDPIGTANDLGAHLASQGRAWCEAPAAEPPPQPWRALYTWAREQAAIRPRVAQGLSSLTPFEQPTLSPADVAALWPPPHVTSVTGLEQYARCAFQHFAARGLRLEERRQYAISPADLGLLYHKVMEQLVNNLLESGQTLRDLSDDGLAETVDQLCRSILPSYVAALQLDEQDERRVGWRSGRELPEAAAGDRAHLGATPVRPDGTERVFGDAGNSDSLPALEVTTPAGRTVQLRGKIDRVDYLDVEARRLAFVVDYKRSITPRLRLDEVYHGLALQLMAYLLVLRDHAGDESTGTILPGGAFYQPLIANLQSVDHPNKATEDNFNPLKPFMPRGVVDFDWIDAIDPDLQSGVSKHLSVTIKQDGQPGYMNRTDSLIPGALPALLDHVRAQLGELADRWLNGDIAVAPARYRDRLPCSYCPYRAVCRFDHDPRQTRTLEPIQREEVMRRLLEGEEAADG